MFSHFGSIMKAGAQINPKLPALKTGHTPCRLLVFLQCTWAGGVPAGPALAGGKGRVGGRELQEGGCEPPPLPPPQFQR